MVLDMVTKLNEEHKSPERELTRPTQAASTCCLFLKSNYIQNFSKFNVISLLIQVGLETGRDLSSWTGKSDGIAPLLGPPQALGEAHVQFPEGVPVDDFTNRSWK